MVRTGIDCRSLQQLTARNLKPILVLGQLGTHSFKILRHQSDAVRFLHSQLLGIPDCDTVARVWSDRRQNRKLIDQLRRQRARYLNTPQTVRGAIYLNGPDQLTMMLLNGQHLDLSAEAGNHIEKRRSRWVHSE